MSWNGWQPKASCTSRIFSDKKKVSFDIILFAEAIHCAGLPKWYGQKKPNQKWCLSGGWWWSKWWQLKYLFIFTPMIREMIHFHYCNIFRMGWNHQLVMNFVQKEGGFHEGNPANISLGEDSSKCFRYLKVFKVNHSQKVIFWSATPFFQPEDI